MITRLSHATLWVLDQEAARRVYTEQLGFEIRTDVTMENGFRWLTVRPPRQRDVEIILLEPKAGPMLDAESAAQLRGLLEKGLLGAGVLETDDCRGTYDDLRRRGVEFVEPPAERFYGIEAILKDGVGNWFSLTERTKGSSAGD
jgi:catechol 2,3-dioxygenase-like lactoylglutathione lyase family enzyme